MSDYDSEYARLLLVHGHYISSVLNAVSVVKQNGYQFKENLDGVFTDAISFCDKYNYTSDEFCDTFTYLVMLKIIKGK